MDTHAKNGRNLATGILVVLVSLSLAGAPALAQDEAVISEQDEQQTLTDDLIGMPVYTQSEQTDGREQIGSIESLLLDEDDRLTGVVVSVGGFLGFGAKSVALDWKAVEIRQWGTSGYVANVGLTRQQLEDAPEFKTLVQKQAREAAERAREEAERQQQEMLEQQQGTGTNTGTGGVE